MSETKGLVKCVLGFLLSILVIVGGIFGIDVKVNVEDTEVEESVATVTTFEPVVDENDSATDNVVESEQSPVESTPAEDQEESADESVNEPVTDIPDEPQKIVTEEGEN